MKHKTQKTDMNPYIICPTQSRHEAGNVDYGIYIPTGLTAPPFKRNSYVVSKPTGKIKNPRAPWAYINHKVPLFVEDLYFDEDERKWIYTLLLQCAYPCEDAYPDWYYCRNPDFELVELNNISEDELTFYAENEEKAQIKYDHVND